MERLFVVGCPRSGTTLFQAMLARHPAIFTVPETHFFQKIRGRFQGSSPTSLVSPRAAAKALHSLLDVSGADSTTADIPRWWVGSGRYSRAFRRVLDEAAELAGAIVWVEKSPVHLHYMDIISRHLPEARYAHVLRDGRDVVASLVDLCERDPELWVRQLIGPKKKMPERRELIDAAIARWNSDLARSLNQIEEANHILLSYEDLIENAKGTLTGVCSFLGVGYHTNMEDHSSTAAEVVGRRLHLPHMENVLQPLQDKRLQRFDAVFDAGERQDITALLRFGGDNRSAMDAFRSQ